MFIPVFIILVSPLGCSNANVTSDLEMQVMLAANSCVTKNICEAADYEGFPAVRISSQSFFQLKDPVNWQS